MSPHLRLHVLAAAAVGLSTGAHAAAAQTAAAGAAVPNAGRVALRGTVFDSLAGAPLADAVVQVVREDAPAAARSVRTDSSGRFTFDSLAPGRYVLGYLHPALATLGLDTKPVLVDLTAGASGEVALAAPSGATVRAALCPALAPDDSAGALAGSVRDAATDAPAPEAALVITWREVLVTRQGLRPEERRVPVTLRGDGSFVVCGVPSDGPVQLSARAPGRGFGPLEVAVPPRGFAVQHFAMAAVRPPLPPADAPASATTEAPPGAAGSMAAARTADPSGAYALAAGTGRLTGVVVDPNGRPVAGARVRVAGTAARALTDSAGRFALGALPAGTVEVEARAIGLAPLRLPVTVPPDRPRQVRLAMAKPAVELDRVVVVGTRAPAYLVSSGFWYRQATKVGSYLGPAEIAKERPLAQRASDYIRRVPSMLRVIPVGSGGYVIRGGGRGGVPCVPTVYLDGVQIRADDLDALAPPGTIAGIEVYNSGSVIPFARNATS